MKKLYLHLCARNDVNGNPRRLFVIYNTDGERVNVIDEGYAGDRVKVRYPEAVYMGRIEITAFQYKRLEVGSCRIT